MPNSVSNHSVIHFYNQNSTITSFCTHLLPVCVALFGRKCKQCTVEAVQRVRSYRVILLVLKWTDPYTLCLLHNNFFPIVAATYKGDFMPNHIPWLCLGLSCGTHYFFWSCMQVARKVALTSAVLLPATYETKHTMSATLVFSRIDTDVLPFLVLSLVTQSLVPSLASLLFSQVSAPQVGTGRIHCLHISLFRLMPFLNLTCQTSCVHSFSWPANENLITVSSNALW